MGAEPLPKARPRTGYCLTLSRMRLARLDNERLADGSGKRLHRPHPTPSSHTRPLSEDARQLVQPSEVEGPAEPDAEPIIDALKEATDVDCVPQHVIEIVAKQAPSGDGIRHIFTNDKARIALDDFIASGYAGPAPKAVSYTHLTLPTKRIV